MLPSTLTAGQTFSVTATPVLYSAADGWALRLILSPVGFGSKLTINSTPSGTDHVLQASAAATAGWAPGPYNWEIWAIKGADQYRQSFGKTTVETGLIASDTWSDKRTQAEKNLDAIEQTLAGKADNATAFYIIAGRQLQSYSLTELRKLRDDYRREVASEKTAARLAAGLGSRQRLVVRM